MHNLPRKAFSHNSGSLIKKDMQKFYESVAYFGFDDSDLKKKTNNFTTY